MAGRMFASALAASLLFGVCAGMRASERLKLREEVREMFHHGFDKYMEIAYPLDELAPLTCAGRSRDPDRHNTALNDVLGGYPLTLIDSMDTLAIMGNRTGLKWAIDLVLGNVTFDLDARVQVFETTIRALGPLLSVHILVADPDSYLYMDDYNGGLLDLAHDLGRRFLPAFEDSTTDLPYARVNLRTGVSDTEVTETCTAGAGSLLLEFGVLSRLVGDPIFETYAKRALFALWDQRSAINLIGNSIDIKTKAWRTTMTGVGAGVDSFFEYIYKSYILFGDDAYLSIFQDAYTAMYTYIRDLKGVFYRQVNRLTGDLSSAMVDALSAFMPGLQVLVGDIDSAVRMHEGFYTLWRVFGLLPERYYFKERLVGGDSYYLRPELIESTYMLYQFSLPLIRNLGSSHGGIAQATKDHYYLRAGEKMLRDLQQYTKVECGFATVSSVFDKTHADRMESFFLSETLKYLYLLFDEENPIHSKRLTSLVFTTEAHPLYLPKKLVKPFSKKEEMLLKGINLRRKKSRKNYLQVCPNLRNSGVVRKMQNAQYKHAINRHVVRQEVKIEDEIPVPLMDYDGLDDLFPFRDRRITYVWANNTPLGGPHFPTDFCPRPVPRDAFREQPSKPDPYLSPQHNKVELRLNNGDETQPPLILSKPALPMGTLLTAATSGSAVPLPADPAAVSDSTPVSKPIRLVLNSDKAGSLLKMIYHTDTAVYDIISINNQDIPSGSIIELGEEGVGQIIGTSATVSNGIRSQLATVTLIVEHVRDLSAALRSESEQEQPYIRSGMKAEKTRRGGPSNPLHDKDTLSLSRLFGVPRIETSAIDDYTNLTFITIPARIGLIGSRPPFIHPRQPTIFADGHGAESSQDERATQQQQQQQQDQQGQQYQKQSNNNQRGQAAGNQNTAESGDKSALLANADVYFDRDNAKGCRRFSPHAAQKVSKAPTIIVVDRGDCLFATKAAIAQAAGAVGLIVINNEVGTFQMSGANGEQQILEQRLERERSGVPADTTLHIPCVMVSNDVGDLLRFLGSKKWDRAIPTDLNSHGDSFEKASAKASEQGEEEEEEEGEEASESSKGTLHQQHVDVDFGNFLKVTSSISRGWAENLEGSARSDLQLNVGGVLISNLHVVQGGSVRGWGDHEYEKQVAEAEKTEQPASSSPAATAAP